VGGTVALGRAHFFFPFFLISPGQATDHFSRTRPPSHSRCSPAPVLLDPGPPHPGPTYRRPDPPYCASPCRVATTRRLPPSCSLLAQPKTESSAPSLHFLVSARADGTRSKPSPPSPPLVAYSSTPTVGVPPLIGNLAAPPALSPLLGESHPAHPLPLPL
jgi:hypothetical protein